MELAIGTTGNRIAANNEALHLHDIVRMCARSIAHEAWYNWLTCILNNLCIEGDVVFYTVHNQISHRNLNRISVQQLYF